MEAIFLIRQVMERYREKNDLHMFFIDLEKAYDKIPRNVMWWALDKHKVPTKYVGLIKDMQGRIYVYPSGSADPGNLLEIYLKFFNTSANYSFK